jgi:hypothetical protein
MSQPSSFGTITLWPRLDREQLRRALEQAEHDGLEVRDRVHLGRAGRRRTTGTTASPTSTTTAA